MPLTNVESTTKIRLIDREEWSRHNRHDVPLTAVSYIDFCEVELSADEVISKMHENGYMSVFVIGEVAYVVIISRVGYDDEICRYIAHDIFGVEHNIVHVHPGGSTDATSHSF